jgi:hypothetical protein
MNNNQENISQIKWCKKKALENAFAHGIYTWDDPRLTAEIMKINKNKVTQVNNFINANRNNEVFDVYYKFDGTEMYLDIENTNEHIFMIGVYFNNKFYQWTANELNDTEELRIINEYNSFIESNKAERIYIWSKHEITKFKEKEKKYGVSINTENFYDFCEFLDINNYAIPGLFSHTLKAVGKLFYQKGYIKSTWENDILDGKDAMEQSILLYKTKGSLEPVKNYNYIDVKVMQEIIEYFKTKI